MALTREDVASLAHLARIALNEEELDRASDELEGILGYVDRLQEIDTDGVEEAAPAPRMAPAFRVDTAVWSDDATRQLILKNFPAKGGDLLKAPAVFERPKK
jgi:aspartyl-tRNA(Asn)/glutamyl-tRNA(Gln) amidotransferase subunit C